MTKWLSVKDVLPMDGAIVKVRWCRFSVPQKAIFKEKRFIYEGESITDWVHHWKPLKKEGEL